MTKKALASGEQVFQILQLLSETERNEFWKLVAINGTWKGTSLDHALYVSLFEYRFREETGNTPDKTTMKKACEMVAEHVFATATKGVREVMLFMMTIPAAEAEQPTRATREEKVGLSATGKVALSKDQLMEVVQTWGAVEARKKFRKPKRPENEQLEQDIIAICKVGMEKPAHIWRELKGTGLYPELSEQKVRKLKSELKMAGRLG